jgi:hypothetical protein
LCCEAIQRRGNALSEAMGDVVGAKEAHENVHQVKWHEREHRPCDSRKGIALKS